MEPVDNQVQVLVLQHGGERNHPLGTLRFLELGLRRMRSEVVYGQPGEPMRSRLSVPADTALLYPGPGARPLEAVDPATRPRNLMVLDGTWWQAHVLYRDNPWLSQLPSYALSPTRPSRYRVRREPAGHCLSTLESVVEALRLLEPETEGFEQLLLAFDGMVDRHLEQRVADARPRQRRVRAGRPRRAIPDALRGPREQLALLHCEPAAGRGRPFERPPVHVGIVSGDGHRARQWWVRPPGGLLPSDRHMADLGLEACDFEAAISLDGLLDALRDWLRDEPRVLSWNANSTRMLRDWIPGLRDPLWLRTAYCNLTRGRSGSLEEVADREALRGPSLGLRGRVERRLSLGLALLEHLREDA